MTGEIVARKYAGPGDLRAMQGITQSLWGLASRFHIGDLAWQRSQARESEWPTMLWESQGEVIA